MGAFDNLIPFTDINAYSKNEEFLENALAEFYWTLEKNKINRNVDLRLEREYNFYLIASIYYGTELWRQRHNVTGHENFKKVFANPDTTRIKSVAILRSMDIFMAIVENNHPDTVKVICKFGEQVNYREVLPMNIINELQELGKWWLDVGMRDSLFKKPSFDSYEELDGEDYAHSDGAGYFDDDGEFHNWNDD